MRSLTSSRALDLVLLLQGRPNAFDHRFRAMAIGGDLPECGLRLVEIGYRAIEPAETGVGPRDHGRQRLPELMRHRGRDRIACHQARVALATLVKDRAEQPAIKHRDLVQQENQDETAGQGCEGPDRIPADVETHPDGKVT